MTSRVRVCLQRSLSSGPGAAVACFGQCIVDFFGFADTGRGYVKIQLMDNCFTLYGVEPGEESGAVLLRHASLCPVYHLKQEDRQSLPESALAKGVGLGVAIILTSSDNHVLITRRSGHMNTFPGVWVPPGGHVELDESLEEAGLRELHEEVGIRLSNITSHMLGLWESVYPHTLEFGMPKRQHIVVYLAIKSTASWKELSNQLELNPDETDAAVWLPESVVDAITTGNYDWKSDSQIVSVTRDPSDGSKQHIEVDASPIIKMMAPAPNATPLELDRLTWGTRFALQRWLEWSRSQPATNSSKL